MVHSAFRQFPGSLPFAAMPHGALKMLHPDDPAVTRATTRRRQRAYALYPGGRVMESEDFGFPVVPLSAIPPDQAARLAHEQDPARWRNKGVVFPALCSFKPCLDGVVGRMLSVGFGDYSFETSPLIWIDTDRPSEVCAWLARAEVAFRRSFGKIEMNYPVGFASYGKCRICQKVPKDEDGWGAWFDSPICSACSLESQDFRRPRRSGRSALPSLGGHVPPDHKTRAALHAVYEGKCQYCQSLTALAFCQIEHIIPISISICDVANVLSADGASKEMVQAFVGAYMPPLHNCVLNYMLACSSCNGRKSDTVLSPMSLELLLRLARKNADNVLRVRYGLR